uniref:Uncharacterized protein n=1 Tax=Sipha flava TaxID=143950 RepID=A0A2S2PW76_9HEMI
MRCPYDGLVSNEGYAKKVKTKPDRSVCCNPSRLDARHWVWCIRVQKILVHVYTHCIVMPPTVVVLCHVGFKSNSERQRRAAVEGIRNIMVFRPADKYPI